MRRGSRYPSRHAGHAHLSDSEPLHPARGAGSGFRRVGQLLESAARLEDRVRHRARSQILLAERKIAMEFWRGRRVLLTGHTGFKGAWMSLWLRRLGARITGLALPPATEPNLWNMLVAGPQGPQEAHSVIGDIRDPKLVGETVARADPQIVIHMAAQALVRESYRDPLATYATNVMGTA